MRKQITKTTSFGGKWCNVHSYGEGNCTFTATPTNETKSSAQIHTDATQRATGGFIKRAKLETIKEE